jgi:hypothetical protein
MAKIVHQCGWETIRGRQRRRFIFVCSAGGAKIRRSCAAAKARRDLSGDYFLRTEIFRIIDRAHRAVYRTLA